MSPDSRVPESSYVLSPLPESFVRVPLLLDSSNHSFMLLCSSTPRIIHSCSSAPRILYSSASWACSLYHRLRRSFVCASQLRIFKSSPVSLIFRVFESFVHVESWKPYDFSSIRRFFNSFLRARGISYASCVSNPVESFDPARILGC